MDKKIIDEYSAKYKKTSKIIIIITSIIILIFGGAVLALGIYFTIPTTNQFENIQILGIVLIVVSFLDLFLGVRYIIFGFRNLKAMKNIDAAKRYMKIRGIKKEEIDNE